MRRRRTPPRSRPGRCGGRHAALSFSASARRGAGASITRRPRRCQVTTQALRLALPCCTPARFVIPTPTYEPSLRAVSYKSLSRSFVSICKGFPLCAGHSPTHPPRRAGAARASRCARGIPMNSRRLPKRFVRYPAKVRRPVLLFCYDTMRDASRVRATVLRRQGTPCVSMSAPHRFARLPLLPTSISATTKSPP
jgi:hypothetical protein